MVKTNPGSSKQGARTQDREGTDLPPMIKAVQTIIEASWHRGPGHWFVFPSEAIAWSWAKYMAQVASVGTISINRFISWDTFKERVFRGQEERRPANSFFRSLFLEEFLQRNAQLATKDSISIGESEENTIHQSLLAARPLSRLIPPAYATEYTGFITTFTRILPGLKPLFEPTAKPRNPGQTEGKPDRFPVPREERETPELGIDRIRHTGNQEVWEDYEVLYTGYIDFLDRHGYYEPRWMFKAPSNPQAQGLVFFPELLDDWEEFGPTIENLPGIRLISLAETTIDPHGGHHITTPELLCARNQAEEVGSLFDWVQGHLETGVRPGEIVLTLGDYDTILPLVEREAWIRGIPLEGRRGRPLTEFPGPGLFQRLSTLESDHYSYQALEHLFCSPAYPLTNQVRTLGKRILEIGIGRDLSFPSKEVWLKELSSPKTQKEKVLFQSLVSVVEQLNRAKKLKSIQGYISQALELLTGGSWQGPFTGALQRAREVLQGLVETEEIVGISPAQPFRFWLNQLDQQVYVPQGRKGVVEVYPYRVTAGMAAKIHGLVNLNQNAVQVVTGGLHFLREDQRELLGTGMYKSRTGDFLRAYSQSGISIRMSANSLTTDGAKIPATWFLQEGRQIPIRWEGKETFGISQGLKFTNETINIERSQEESSQLSLAQALGVNRWNRLANGPSRSILTSWDPDLSIQAVLQANKSYQIGEESNNHLQPWRISNKQFQSFMNCPLEFVGRNLLGIRSQIEYPEFMSPKSQGILYHRIIEELFTQLVDQANGFLSQEALTEGALSPPRVREITWEQTNNLYPQEIVDLVAPEVAANIQELLEAITNNLHNPQIYSREENWVRSTNLTLYLTCSGQEQIPLVEDREHDVQDSSQHFQPKTNQLVEIQLSGIIDGVLTLGGPSGTGIQDQALIEPDNAQTSFKTNQQWLILDFKRTKGANRSPGKIHQWAIGQDHENNEDSADGPSRGTQTTGSNVDKERDGDSTEDSTTEVQLQLLFYSLLVGPAEHLNCSPGVVEKVRNPNNPLKDTYTAPLILPQSLSGLWYGLYVAPKTTGKKQGENRIIPVYNSHSDGKNKKTRGLEGPEELIRAQTRVMEQVERLVQAVQSGTYMEPQGGCPGCPFRGLCRTKFALQMR
jgi:hypothetical protein